MRDKTTHERIYPTNLAVWLFSFCAFCTLKRQFLRDALHDLGEAGLGHCEMKALTEQPRIVSHEHIEFTALLDGSSMLGFKNDFLEYLECNDAVGDES